MTPMSDIVVRQHAATAPVPTTPPVVLVIDFGAQYAQLIARRVREAHVYSEIVPYSTTVEAIQRRRPAAIILSGGPSSVYAEAAPRVDPRLFDLDVPILGICYGFQLMAQALGGTVKRTDLSEFGRTVVSSEAPSLLLAGAPGEQDVWMSHGDEVVTAPDGFAVIARSQGACVAAFEDRKRRLFGMQWHPEVRHTTGGQATLERFLYDGANLSPTWTVQDVTAGVVRKIREEVGSNQVLCGLSGGVDSAVAAALVHEAVGDQLTCVFVDHGLLRKGEREQVDRDFASSMGIKLKIHDASEAFLRNLEGQSDPETKRRIIGREFIRAFEEAAAEVIAAAGSTHPFKYLVQGTLYPDVVESGGGNGTAIIKSHHNVGGLPDDLTFELIEPLRDLFKDEVRAVGRELGLPEAIVSRQPFPGPGLAIRIVGPVDAERLRILREADAIAREEMTIGGHDEQVWQMPVVLLGDVRSVGVQGDGRTYGHPIVLRPVTSEDAMTADWARVDYEVLARISTRITNEVREVNRVLLDITSKPPASIEWE